MCASLSVTSTFITNIFFPQHLSDAKKAQQTLESSFKHLESVSEAFIVKHLLIMKDKVLWGLTTTLNSLE